MQHGVVSSSALFLAGTGFSPKLCSILRFAFETPRPKRVASFEIRPFLYGEDVMFSTASAFRVRALGLAVFRRGDKADRIALVSWRLGCELRSRCFVKSNRACKQ